MTSRSAVVIVTGPPGAGTTTASRAATARTHKPIVLVGQSGGGLLLPPIADVVTVEVVALVFVDSFLPPLSGGMPLAPPGFMQQLRALATDRVLPRWSSWFGEGAMRELVADERLRTALEREMPCLPLSYFEANVPAPDGWDAHPCGYLLLTREPYGASADDARQRGWPVVEIPGAQHLTITTDPIAVTSALLAIERALIGPAETRHCG